jgi:hypothetical protein
MHDPARQIVMSRDARKLASQHGRGPVFEILYETYIEGLALHNRTRRTSSSRALSGSTRDSFSSREPTTTNQHPDDSVSGRGWFWHTGISERDKVGAMWTDTRKYWRDDPAASVENSEFISDVDVHRSRVQAGGCDLIAVLAPVSAMKKYPPVAFGNIVSSGRPLIVLPFVPSKAI